MEIKAKVLVVDDDTSIRDIVATMLQRGGYGTMEADSASSLREAFRGPQPDVVILDLQLPDGYGLDLLPEIKKTWPDTEVVMLTGNASLDAAVEATKRGAYHFQQKPIDHKNLFLIVDRAFEHRLLCQEATKLRQALSAMSGGAAPLFQSASMRAVVRTVERVAPSDASILVTGESGTGKEVIADLIHAMSPRARGPIIKINCAALPRELIESELFGAVKGAFTGSVADREGFFRQAEGGTLFMDEISEMPIDTQSKLLRVLQEKEVRPVGGRSAYKTDCRIVAATNRSVQDAIKEGKLREDLYYRIGAITIDLRPLRERREDILPLANAFLKRFAAQAGRPITGFSESAAEALHQHDWPGNVRQLQNEVQRAVLMVEGNQIEVSDLSISFSNVGKEETELTLLEGMERNTIVQALRETGGNKLEAAKRLGIGRQTLYNKIKAYGIEV